MSPFRIGVFDSGVGGLSVLRELREQLPTAALHYIADTAHAPYGERSDAYVIGRSRWLTTQLLDAGAAVIVVACNTATAAAIQVLRASWPNVPIVGIEPGLKPALAATRNGRVGVMATRGTLASNRFAQLVEQLGRGHSIHLRACDGLAAAIEHGRLDDAQLVELIEQHCAPLREAQIDTVVLGCTHYAFVRHHIQAALGAHIEIIDTAAAVARHTASIASASPTKTGELVLQATGDTARLQRFVSAWLGSEHPVSHLADHAPPER